MDFLTASLQVKSMSIFEAGMIFCFGASWPFALYKTFKTKSAKQNLLCVGIARLYLRYFAQNIFPHGHCFLDVRGMFCVDCG